MLYLYPLTFKLFLHSLLPLSPPPPLSSLFNLFPSLHLHPPPPPPPPPNMCTVIVIGLEMTQYTADESDDSVRVCTLLQSGTIDEDVTIPILFTSGDPGTATGIGPYYWKMTKFNTVSFSLQLASTMPLGL